MAEGGNDVPHVPVDGNGCQDNGMVLAMTEQHVMEAAVAKEWERVKAAVVGQSQQRVALSLEAQVVVLKEAMKDDAWYFIADLAVRGFRFAPDALDKAVDLAREGRHLHFRDRAVLSNIPYQYKDDTLTSALRAFCNVDEWFPAAFLLAMRLPLNLDVDMLSKKVYLPLLHRGTDEPVLKRNLLSILTTRFPALLQ